LLGIILIFVVIVLLAAALHRWERRGQWGYYPGGVLGLALVLLVVLLLLGRI
jgi:Protein of unknown function (DUF3309)